ncbi:MAG TPA: DMT family transporter, partial [Candidatus Limnocylindrales bacterium]|nr:DMT family transporter [Candidatus Limnocylindrales bacterium]
GWLIGLSGVAVSGVALVLFDPAASGQLGGMTVSAAGVLCCAVYTVAARRWIGASDSTVAVVLAQETWALALAAGLVVASSLVGGAVAPVAVTPATLASAVVSGLLYYGFAYWLYLAALRTVPAAVAATSFYLIPLFGLAAAGALGERLEPIQWLGAAVVMGAVGGVAAIQRRAGGAGAARIPVASAPS